MTPTHIVFSKERITFRWDGEAIAVTPPAYHWRFDPPSAAALAEEPAILSLLIRWDRWRTGNLSDLDMLRPLAAHPSSH